MNNVSEVGINILEITLSRVAGRDNVAARIVWFLNLGSRERVIAGIEHVEEGNVLQEQILDWGSVMCRRIWSAWFYWRIKKYLPPPIYTLSFRTRNHCSKISETAYPALFYGLLTKTLSYVVQIRISLISSLFFMKADNVLVFLLSPGKFYWSWL